MHANAMM